MRRSRSSSRKSPKFHAAVAVLIGIALGCVPLAFGMAMSNEEPKTVCQVQPTGRMKGDKVEVARLCMTMEYR